MSATAVPASSPYVGGFRHEALFYEGDAGFLAGTLPFIRGAVLRSEPTLVVVSAHKIDRLRADLNGDTGGVQFIDMGDVGANPARIIPAWREFVEEQGADGTVPMRGIGEPIWAERRPAELVECQHHESLLNLEFADDAPLWLMCPYDTETLGRDVIEGARRSHPYLRHGQIERASAAYRGESLFAAALDDPLPEPPADTGEHRFRRGGLDDVRRFVSHRATSFGIGPGKVVDLVLAVNEVATNSIVHGGGGGVLRAWPTGDAFVCEVRDDGHIDRPLVGRARPAADREGGRGLWLANQLCDLVQVRSSPSGTVVRLYTWRS
ncbi:MAG: anti-sigma factor RsbA family regulatory protein [Acidimicrobiales bacterium]